MPNNEPEKPRRAWLTLVAALLLFIAAGLSWFRRGEPLSASAFAIAGVLFFISGITRLFRRAESSP